MSYIYIYIYGAPSKARNLTCIYIYIYIYINTITSIYRNTKVRIKFNEDLSEPIRTNKGVRQGYGLSSVLFNIYINKIVQEFKTMIKKGIQLNNRKYINTKLYADDQILMATSEDELQ
jgi:hypothetical protein